MGSTLEWVPANGWRSRLYDVENLLLYLRIMLVSAGEILGFLWGAVALNRYRWTVKFDRLAMWEPDIQEKES